MSIFSDVTAIRAGQDKIVKDLDALTALLTKADGEAQTAWAGFEAAAADFVAAQRQTNVLLQKLLDYLNPPEPPVTGLAVDEHPPTPRP